MSEWIDWFTDYFTRLFGDVWAALLSALPVIALVAVFLMVVNQPTKKDRRRRDLDRW